MVTEVFVKKVQKLQSQKTIPARLKIFEEAQPPWLRPCAVPNHPGHAPALMFILILSSYQEIRRNNSSTIFKIIWLKRDRQQTETKTKTSTKLPRWRQQHSRPDLVIGVGAQLLGGKTFLPGNYVWKNYPNSRIFMTIAWKINKIPEFYMIFAPKMPEFYMIIAREIFSHFFFLFLGWGACPP